MTIRILVTALLLAGAASGAAADDPAPHWADPVVTYPAHLDRDGDRVLDSWETHLQSVPTHGAHGLVEILVVLQEEPTVADVLAFEKAGGRVQAVWRHATYGLWGRIPVSSVGGISDVFGSRLAYVQGSEGDGHADMDLGTQLIGARNRTWVTYGYEGDEDGSIAILDSGLDGPHDDLADPDGDNVEDDPGDWWDACANGWNGAFRIVGWWDNYQSVSNPVDFTGHGTAVAACAAGDGSLNPLLKGVAPKSHLVGFRMGEGVGHSTTRAIDAMNTAIANKVCARIKALNVSISFNPLNPQLLVDAANNVVRNGIVMTCSAGNGYDNGPCSTFHYVVYPGRADRVITVGSSTDDDQVAGFSSNGPPGLAKPDLLAPGGNQSGSQDLMTADNNPDDTYTSRGQTSMSAPIVAGAASLLIDAYEQVNATSWGWTEAEALLIKSTLLMTAVEIQEVGEDPGSACGDDLPPNSPGTKDRGGHDPVEGYGRLNVDAGVEALTMSLAAGNLGTGTLGSAPTDKKVWARGVTVQGPTATFDLDVPAGGDFDLYVYAGTPDTSGIPVIEESSVNPATGADESLTLNLGSGLENYVLVVKWVSGDGAFGVSFDDASTQVGVPEGAGSGSVWALPAAPNPFRDRSEIRFSLTASGKVSLVIYDLAGRPVRTLIAGNHLGEGEHRSVWDGRDATGRKQPPGIFFYRLQAGSRRSSGKLILVP